MFKNKFYISTMLLFSILISASLKSYGGVETETMAERTKRINENIGGNYTDLSEETKKTKNAIEGRKNAIKNSGGVSLKEELNDRMERANGKDEKDKEACKKNTCNNAGPDEDVNIDNNALLKELIQYNQKLGNAVSDKAKETKEYYENGNIKSEKSYKNEKLDGESKFYSSDGTLKAVYFYSNNELNGKTKIFYEDGQTIKGEVPYKNNQLNGKGIIYFPNGKIQSKTMFKNDKQDGVSLIYDANGKLLHKDTYREGKLIKRKNF